MEITRIFEFMQKIWLSLVAITTPVFDWLSTELEGLEMTPFELIFGIGIIGLLVHAITKFFSPI